ncbi:BglG family transcription antiterminator [Enterococcus sp. HY326]|uniref:BglG family transcription antiterminator n=1 Tax=Enterococcus sp. HY326 TaxID=2971265 RepID=UPI00223FFDB3|nr:PRD domain-containing protein [Enterococcus sp. HY326]
MLQLREKKLVQLLMANQTKQTSETLADALAVSSKTIKNDVKRINQEFADKPYQIVSQKGKGIWLEFAEDERNELQLLTAFQQENSPEETELRRFEILHLLLDQQNYLSVGAISEAVFASSSTILRDLDSLADYLREFNLEIERAPRKGIRLLGSEIALRIIKAELLKQETSVEAALLDFVEIQKTFPEISLAAIKAILFDFQQEQAFKLSDVALKGLIIHIAISLQRLQNNQFIEMTADELAVLTAKKEWQLASQLYQKLAEHFDLAFEKSEVGYLTIHLLGANLANQTYQETELSGYQQIDQELLSKLIVWTTAIDNTFQTQLAQDQQFLTAFLLHLKPLLNRLSYGINIKNPWSRELKQKYPRAYEIGVAYAELIYQETNLLLNEDEICYLVLHIETALDRQQQAVNNSVTAIIVCATGMGTSYFLKTKLQQAFPELEIIGISSAMDQSLPQTTADLIISTVPIQVPQKKVVYVSPVLNATETAGLQQQIQQVGQKESSLTSLLTEDLINLHVELDSVEKIIQFGAASLAKAGYVTADFAKSALQREKLSATAIGNLVAIPHAYQGNVQQQGIAVLQLAKPIDWSGEQVQLVFLLAIDSQIQQQFASIFEELALFTQDLHKVKQVIQAPTKKEVRHLLLT